MRVNPIEEGQLLTQVEILCRERCSGDDQAPDEQKESGDEDHKGEARQGKKDEPDDGAEWLMISLTASSSRRDDIFGRDNGQHADGDIHRYVLQIVYPCVCNRGLAGRRAEAILDRHRLFDVPARKI